ncbi:AI-2E family transporter [Plectonema cf. radiosum LEGE 06105]|uniref:AI-2E family transporter n=1 Tax=Plectonema cf. radiosum LEGE 06105 TaxID=945769 RepID=A0A8J7F9Z2_9CYAN|nr:AI-2E family transporter [Plectonema radiosum]MBE9217190.1 AI-2E family transporter [Plectonema cf. radiosum LEGE 06105]
MNLGQWIGLIALTVSLYILWQIKEAILLVFAAVVLATTLNRLARRLQRLGIRRGFAKFLSIVIFLVGVIGFFWLIVPPFIVQFQELSNQIPKALVRLNAWLLQFRERLPPQVIPSIPDINSLLEQAQPFINRGLESTFLLVSGSLEVILKILLVFVLTGMFLADPLSYRKLFVRFFPSFYRRRIEGILDQCEVSLEGWITGASIAMFLVGFLSLLGLMILQVRSALALGVLAGFLNLIPNLGPTLSVFPAMAIALLDSPWKPLAVLVLYFFIQQVESNFITPMVMAQQLSLLPAVTLISQLFFVTFFGFLGLFLALPLTVVAKIWMQEIVIKDVLDQWNLKSKTQADCVILADNVEINTSEESVNIESEQLIVDEKG